MVIGKIMIASSREMQLKSENTFWQPWRDIFSRYSGRANGWFNHQQELQSDGINQAVDLHENQNIGLELLICLLRRVKRSRSTWEER